MKKLISLLLILSTFPIFASIDLELIKDPNDPIERIWVESEILPKNKIKAKVLTQLNKVVGLHEFTQTQNIKLAILSHKTSLINWSFEFDSRLEKILKQENLEKESIYLLFSERKILNSKLIKQLKQKYPAEWKTFKANIAGSITYSTNEELKELFDQNLDLSLILGPEYNDSIRLFVFCHSDRTYPCIKVMKDRFNQIVLNEDGTIWNQPSLALSKYGYPYDKRNGYTPAGVYTLDSVMPYADGQTSYGKFRRIIMNFIDNSKTEEKTKSLLTQDIAKASWWKQASVARDIGRGSLRIHGTGLINTNPQSTYYPFMPSSGCLKNRENTYDGIEYKDQRIMLDTMMKNLNLNISYENETQIKGIMYLIEIPGEKAVTLDEIKPIIE